jgi:diaminobutyrate-2-oxoglutarate transaminase
VADTKVFEELESEVRSYCRRWPTVFSKAKGSHVYDEDGRAYLDFFAGAGALNYGHNHPHLKEALLRYVRDDSIVHSLDMYTTAKRHFLQAFRQNILSPRGLDYKVQFPGPAGTTAVEAALKLARKFTGRRTVVSFTNGFHGMTLGALALTGHSANVPGAQAGDAVVMPYDQDHDGQADSLLLLERLLADSGRETPAAVIVETVQGEGGIHVASAEWLHGLARICKSHEMLLIVDDVQMGCGRTGPFFSFEQSGIYPDIVCLSKSLSGYGIPFALTLLRPELDIWEPGEHSGTFRGPNLAFVTAVAALDFWRDETFEKKILDKSRQVERAVREIALEHDAMISEVRGRGLAWGVAFHEPKFAGEICASAFESGLLVETNGFKRDTIKLMPPLIITDEHVAEGLDLLRDAIRRATPNNLFTKPSGEPALG